MQDLHRSCRKKVPLTQNGQAVISKKDFVEEGYNIWKNAPKRLSKHETGEFHHDAVKGLAALANSNNSIVNYTSNAKN